jgi:beta-lactamase regulating signal transducer with metallopeptidase domain
MISFSLSAIVNHLWQSTLFGVAVWLLTLTLRKNRAAVRHGLWLSASVKFLWPCSWLVSIGNRFGGRTAPVMEPTGWPLAMEQLFFPSGLQAVAPVAVSSTATTPTSPIPALLLTAWAIGVAVVLWSWWRQWQPVRAALHRAMPLHLALPHLTPTLTVLSSPDLLEPGIIGIRAPVLVLPVGITDRLTPAELHAIIAHEWCHVRRRDNLVATLHMIIEALYWFHPMVWWIEGTNRVHW